MRKILRILSNAELMALVMFTNILFTYLFLINTPETKFTQGLYYLLERLDYLVMAIVGYNIVSKKYHILVIPACSIVVMRLFNECLHLFNVVQLNNQILLTAEFLLTLYILWRVSKVTY